MLEADKIENMLAYRDYTGEFPTEKEIEDARNLEITSQS